MLSPKVRSMRLFNAFKHSEIVDAVLWQISQRQAALANLKRDGKDSPEVMAAMRECLEHKALVRRRRFPIEAVLVPAG